MRGVEGLMFDCDGTLADTMPAHYESWCATLAPYGLSFDEGLFYSMGGWPSFRIVEYLAGKNGIDLDVKAVSLEKNRRYLDQIGKARAIEPVVSIARQYAGVLPMAVATGSVRWVCIPLLRHLGIEGLFDAIVCAEDVELHKPNPDVFLEAAARIRIEPEKCLVFEDTEPGFQAAKLAGMRFVDVAEFV